MSKYKLTVKFLSDGHTDEYYDPNIRDGGGEEVIVTYHDITEHCLDGDISAVGKTWHPIDRMFFAKRELPQYIVEDCDLVDFLNSYNNRGLNLMITKVELC